MIVNENVKELYAGTTHWGNMDEPSICPLCKKTIKPVQLYSTIYFNEDKNAFLSMTYLCKSCYQSFVTLSLIEIDGNSRFIETKKIYVEPNCFVKKPFSDCICSISPNFVQIYNEALAAESYSLNEIAGMGYRKALEYLIKDYLISVAPEDEEKIKEMALGNCIANKIPVENLKIVAQRSAWLGNDFTHYVRKYEDKDISDLKSFIEATVYWISMELITKDALNMV